MRTMSAIAVALSLMIHGLVEGQPLFEETTQGLGVPPFPTEGIAVADYDNDGWPDLFVTEVWAKGRRIALLQNLQGKRFVDRTSDIQADIAPLIPKGGPTFGDYDRDGDLDLFVPVGHVGYPFRLRGPKEPSLTDAAADSMSADHLLQNGNGRFSDVAGAAGVVTANPSAEAMWLDVDRDGWLDLYVGHTDCCPADTTLRNSLYHNLGDGTFGEVSAAAGLLVGEFSEWGGSGGGGCGASDFDDDGWPDLYLASYNGPNRLFLSDGEGGFQDHTTEEVGDRGEAFGVALGDVNNDGRIDIFQPGGSTPQFGKIYDSLLLLNLGGGEFTDVTDAAGLQELRGENAVGAGFADVDNDGDLDLIKPTPFRLFLNRGDGTFEDHSAASGVADVGNSVSVGDYDRDGFLDLFFGMRSNLFAANAVGRSFRNLGNGNHWLRVELAGDRSDRNGIGTRLIARSGSLRQTREVRGGFGWTQHELVAHFGLAEHTTVAALEIRWPSGRVDVLTDIAADQRIRVVEGRQEYWPASASEWLVMPPDTVVVGRPAPFVVSVRPALFEPSARITSVVADLSSLGGPAATPLADQGDGSWRLAADVTVATSDSLATVDVYIDQETSLGPRWIRMSRQVRVTPPSTAVVESHTPATPAAIALHPAYPNPFNPETTIPFDLPAPADVELAVYNVAGQRVATLVSGRRVAGSYLLHWDGRDDDGRQLATGVYLTRLAAGGQLRTRKLLLLQ